MKKSVRCTVERSKPLFFIFVLVWSLVVSSGERIYKSDSILIKTADDPEGDER